MCVDLEGGVCACVCVYGVCVECVSGCGYKGMSVRLSIRECKGV